MESGHCCHVIHWKLVTLHITSTAPATHSQSCMCGAVSRGVLAVRAGRGEDGGGAAQCKRTLRGTSWFWNISLFWILSVFIQLSILTSMIQQRMSSCVLTVVWSICNLMQCNVSKKSNFVPSVLWPGPDIYPMIMYGMSDLWIPIRNCTDIHMMVAGQDLFLAVILTCVWIYRISNMRIIHKSRTEYRQIFWYQNYEQFCNLNPFQQQVVTGNYSSELVSRNVAGAWVLSVVFSQL